MEFIVVTLILVATFFCFYHITGSLEDSFLYLVGTLSLMVLIIAIATVLKISVSL
jgi:hypothetical protein